MRTAPVDVARDLIRSSRSLMPYAIELDLSQPLHVRDYRSGDEVAIIPAHLTRGLVPMVHRGLVVGYCRESAHGQSLPSFSPGWQHATYWIASGRGTWAMLVDGGEHVGYVKID